MLHTVNPVGCWSIKNVFAISVCFFRKVRHGYQRVRKSTLAKFLVNSCVKKHFWGYIDFETCILFARYLMPQKKLDGNSSVVKCPPLNWKVGCSTHCHWVNCRSAPWARAFTSSAPARSTIQASTCRQLSSPKKINYKKREKAPPSNTACVSWCGAILRQRKEICPKTRRRSSILTCVRMVSRVFHTRLFVGRRRTQRCARVLARSGHVQRDATSARGGGFRFVPRRSSFTHRTHLPAASRQAKTIHSSIFATRPAQASVPFDRYLLKRLRLSVNRRGSGNLPDTTRQAEVCCVQTKTKQMQMQCLFLLWSISLLISLQAGHDVHQWFQTCSRRYPHQGSDHVLVTPNIS